MDCMTEVTEEVMVVNALGMHARPAAALVQTTLRFESDVHINFRGNTVNGKSIMGLLTLGAACATFAEAIMGDTAAEAATHPLFGLKIEE